MDYPKLKAVKQERDMISAFLGYNHNLRIRDSEFYDMQNMTSDYYPVLGNRQRRGKIVYDEIVNSIVPNKSGSDGFIASHSDRYMVKMGAYVLGFPSKTWRNLETGEEGSMESSMVESFWHLAPCEWDGKEITVSNIGEQANLNPEDGEYWFDTSGRQEYYLRKYNSGTDQWDIVDGYVRLRLAVNKTSSDTPGIFTQLFESYDTVELEILDGVQPTPDPEYVFEFDNPAEEMLVTDTTRAVLALTGTKTLRVLDENTVVVNGLLPERISIGNYISFKRTVPDFDVVFECGNRLWGAKYGSVGDQVVNEIYCSKLGDFKNFRNFKGVSTDSYVASVGEPGRFTGGINYNGYPLFFKERSLHRVYGSYPSQFQIQIAPCHGVEHNSKNSLQMLNGKAYYLGDNGIYRYDGSLPVRISEALGDITCTDGAAGIWRGKYYISMEGGNYPDWSLFAYDSEKGLWHREDDLRISHFASCLDGLYGINGDNAKEVIKLTGATNNDEGSVSWMAETGQIGLDSPDTKYISALTVRMSAALGTAIRFYVQYDFAPEWELLYSMTANELKSFYIPLRPKRCDYMKLRIEGEGDVKIYSITKTIMQGGEKP